MITPNPTRAGMLSSIWDIINLKVITEDLNKRRKYKIILDIVVILAIFSFINIILRVFNIKIPVIGHIGIPFLLAVLLFFMMFTFAWRLKKWGWILLNSLIFVGIILNLIGGALSFADYMNSLSSEEKMALAKSGELVGYIPETLGYQILYYGGYILLLIGSLSLILFYFLNLRRYLKGTLTLKNIGGERFASEKQFAEDWQRKEKRQNKIGLIIIIIILLFIVGYFVWSFLFG